MKLKAASGIMLTLLFIGVLMLAFSIQRTEGMEPPETEWARPYGGGGNDYAFSVVETSDGGYVLAGRTNSFGAGGDDFWLVKTNSNGDAVWNKTYGGGGNDEAFSVVETGDGGYAIAGFTWSFGAGNCDFWLVKTDSVGNMEWNRTYGGSELEIAFSVVEIGNGGYVLAGSTGSFGAGGDDFWLVRIAPPKPVGGKATPINIPMNNPETPALWIWLTTIILSLAVTVVYVKKRKRNTEINS